MQRNRRTMIPTMALIVSGSLLVPSSCGSDEEATPSSEAPAVTAEEPPETAVPTTGVVALNEQLIAAVRSGDVDEVQALLDAGAEVDATANATSGSWTYADAPAITHAVLTGHIDVLELLIVSGADLDKPELGYKDTALHTAAHLDDAEAVHLLLAHGADPQPVSKHWNWETPLHYAAEAGALDAIAALLDDGVEVDVQVDGRRTALMNVVKEGSAPRAAEVAPILLDRGADPNLPDLEGRTTLHSAADRGLVDLVLLCIDHGADIDLQDDRGDTALHLATRSSEVETVAVLVEAGASSDVTNNDGKTAADLVDDDEIASLLP